MKKLPVVLGIIAIIISATALFFSRSGNQLVYVDVNKLIDGYTRTKDINKQLEKKSTLAKTNIDSMQNMWQQEIKNYERERQSLSANELKMKQALMASRQQQINDYENAVTKKMQEESQKTTQTVINDINDYVKEYGKNNGYTIIFGASGGGSIMYARESSDLTEDVLKGLNEEYAKK